LRALLFAPGADERKLSKLNSFGADAIVIDLEDAVAESQKTAARALARAAIPNYGDTQVVAVRVNSIESGRLEADIAAVACPQLAAVVVPKVQHPDTLHAADRALVAAERENGVETGTIRLMPLIETALGIVRVEGTLLNAPARTLTAVFGLADLAAELGVDLTAEGAELQYARGRVIVAARAADMVAPIDGPYLKLRHDSGLIADCRRSRALGFQGRVTLHPQQVASTQRVYSELSDEELAAQRRIVEAFEGAQRTGLAAVQVDGRFVDQPVYQLARRRLAGYESLVVSGE
jgi:citrate lyase subunit beta / citryl-CoA lyase